MTRQSAIVKREKSLAEQVITILMFAIFMGVFIHYFFKNEQELTSTGFASLSGNFISRLSVIRSQWYMQSRQQVLWLQETDGAGNKLVKRKVTVNREGWVDSTQAALGCQHIWQMVMNAPLVFMKQPIAAIELQHNENYAETKAGKQLAGKVCRYAIPAGQYFDYAPTTGKVLKP
jgi:hypothetical protein